jgi:hypothetical protein
MARRFKPRGQKPETAPYTVYDPHTRPPTERKWEQDYYQVVSIDPASKTNVGFRIERRYKTGRIIMIAFVRFTMPPDEAQYAVFARKYTYLTTMFNKYRNEFFESHFVIVERQLPINYKAVRVSQHILSYFEILLADAPLLPIIMEVDPKLKGQVLGAPPGLKSKDLKKSLRIIAANKKKDDLADTTTQLEAVMVFLGYPSTVRVARLVIVQPPIKPTLIIEAPPVKTRLIIGSK